MSQLPVCSLCNLESEAFLRRGIEFCFIWQVWCYCKDAHCRGPSSVSLMSPFYSHYLLIMYVSTPTASEADLSLTNYHVRISYLTRTSNYMLKCLIYSDTVLRQGHYEWNRGQHLIYLHRGQVSHKCFWQIKVLSPPSSSLHINTHPCHIGRSLYHPPQQVTYNAGIRAFFFAYKHYAVVIYKHGTHSITAWPEHTYTHLQ